MNNADYIANILINQNIVVKNIGNTIILFDSFDDRQLWLPFINGINIKLKETIPVKKSSDDKRKIKILMEKKYASIPYYCTFLYYYEKGVEQYVLPFNHWNIFSISHWQRITDAGHPTWDRLNGELLSFRYNNKDILDFLKDNCIGRFYLKNNNRVFFQRMQDYIIAKTAFCVGD